MRLIHIAHKLTEKGVRFVYHLEENKMNVWQYIVLSRRDHVKDMKADELVDSILNLIKRFHKYGNWQPTRKAGTETIAVHPYRLLRSKIIGKQRLRKAGNG